MSVSNVGTEVNFNIAQGTDFSAPLQMFASDGVTAINITGYTFSADIKLSAVSSIVYASFSCSITNASLGNLTLSLPAASSALLPAGDTIQGIAEGTYVWDLKAVDTTGLTTRPFFGTVTIQAEVTP